MTAGSFKAKSFYIFIVFTRPFVGRRVVHRRPRCPNGLSRRCLTDTTRRRLLPAFTGAHFLLRAPSEKDDNNNFCHWIRCHQQQQHLHKWRHHQRQNRAGGFQGNYHPVSHFHRTGRSAGALEWTLWAELPPRLLAEWKILQNQALYLERIETGRLVSTQPIIFCFITNANCLITDSPPGTEVVGKGRHIFPFSFQIPDRYVFLFFPLDSLVLLPTFPVVLRRKIPSTFKASIGKVVHKLKAELKQSMKLTKKAKSHFTFVSKPHMEIPGLMVRTQDCQRPIRAVVLD